MKIAANILDILNNGRVDGNKYYLPDEKLDRKTYVAVNKILDLLKGKWNKKEKAHVFPEDVDNIIADAIAMGEVTDMKKVFQFYPTPEKVAKMMVEMAGPVSGLSILEPSAGRGAILAYLPEDSNVDVCELMPESVEYLKKHEYNVVASDFLKYSGKKYDIIIANPPFSKQQDVDHVMHMYNLLEDGGKIVTIMSESPFFRESKKAIKFRELYERVGESVELDQDAFKSSGVSVRTRIVILTK